MAKVVTMGEIMLRLSPPGYQRFVHRPRSLKSIMVVPRPMWLSL